MLTYDERSVNFKVTNKTEISTKFEIVWFTIKESFQTLSELNWHLMNLSRSLLPMSTQVLLFSNGLRSRLGSAEKEEQKQL